MTKRKFTDLFLDREMQIKLKHEKTKKMKLKNIEKRKNAQEYQKHSFP